MSVAPKPVTPPVTAAPGEHSGRLALVSGEVTGAGGYPNRRAAAAVQVGAAPHPAPTPSLTSGAKAQRPLGPLAEVSIVGEPLYLFVS